MNNEDPLSEFRKIAAQCSEDECLELIQESEKSNHPFINGPVRQIYQNRLQYLQNQRREIEFHEQRLES